MSDVMRYPLLILFNAFAAGVAFSGLMLGIADGNLGWVALDACLFVINVLFAFRRPKARTEGGE